MNMYRLHLKDIARDYPFRSRFMERNGSLLHYVDEGAGEPVVMLHGNPTWSFYFRNLIHGLSSAYRAIALDHLGCGLSDVPSEERYKYILRNRIDDLYFFIDRLKLREPLTLVVHDWGGMIGLAYATAHPDRIGRLVITNTAAFPLLPNKRLPWRLRLARDYGRLSAWAVRRLNLFAIGALFMAAKSRLPRAVKAGLIAPYDTWHHRLAVLRFVQDIPLTESDPSYGLVKSTAERLSNLSAVPMLICWGLKDFVFDADYLAEWQRRFPSAEVHAFPEAGHYLFEDAPDATVHLVRRFLDTHPPARGIIKDN